MGLVKNIILRTIFIESYYKNNISNSILGFGTQSFSKFSQSTTEEKQVFPNKKNISSLQLTDLQQLKFLIQHF
jgi:hypothetical protein